MSGAYDFDLFVIGAGSAGVRCARVSAQLGAKVAIAENRYMGGTCVNVGCVPKKMFVYASEFSHAFETAKGYGWSVGKPELNWQSFIAKKTEEIKRLNGIYNNLLLNSGATVLNGTAKIVDSHCVEVNNKSYRCKNIVIAVGGWPRKGEYTGAEHAITSNEIFNLQELPKRIIVEGGGYIAVEFAGILHGLGCEVELVYRGPLFLRGFQPEIREALVEAYKNKGIKLSFNTEIESIKKHDNSSLTVADNNGNQREVDALLSAIGRRPMTDELGLENLNLEVDDAGFIVTDSNFKTAAANVFALGDVVGKLPLTPVALEEGMALANHLFNHQTINLTYENIPTAVFSQPELATVGLTTEQAAERGLEVEVFQSKFKPLKHTISGLDDRAFMILIVEKQTQKVLGCHMLGDHAGEIMQGLAIAVKMGATKVDFDKTVGIHPTAAEEWVTMR